MNPSYETLSTGARKCLALFDWYIRKFGACFPSIAYLAKTFKVACSTVMRWTRELEAAGAIRKRRRGPKSNAYEILWKKPWESQGDLFSEAVEKPVEKSGHERSFERSNERSCAPVSITEFSELKNQNQAGVKMQQNQHPRRLLDQPWSPTERRAVEEAIAYFPGTWEGSRATGLVSRLERIAKYYGKNGFQVAAELERVRRQVERRPSTAPESMNWFCAVVESRFKRQGGEERKIVARAEINPVVQSAEQMRQSGIAQVDTDALVRDLAQGKGLLGAIGWSERKKAG